LSKTIVNAQFRTSFLKIIAYSKINEAGKKKKKI
jgi:hypothetical protein